MKVTKDTVIGDMLMEDYTTAAILMGSGMNCFACPISQGETIEEACMVHGMDCEQLLEALNEYLEIREEHEKREKEKTGRGAEAVPAEP